MADTPKIVIRLIDNIKLELYEGNRKKYVQIWDPTGNNTYNEGDGGPSGIKSPERSKKYSSAENDDDIIHDAIQNSQIVQYYRLKIGKYSTDYFNYLQNPFSETPPPKRIYGGGGLGTPEVDNVGPTPYYLNNGCKVNVKWTGKVPNPDFKLGTFSTPNEAERYNKSLDPEGPPRFLEDQPILSDEDDVKSPTLRPQSEWILEQGGYDPKYKSFNSSGQQVIGFTYSAGYRDKPEVKDKFVTVTLPPGFTENDGKGYLEYVGSGDGRGFVYSTTPKQKVNRSTVGISRPGTIINYETPDISVKNVFNEDSKDDYILDFIINDYQSRVSSLYHTSMYDYTLKVCFPDTGTCSPIPYKSPVVNLSEVGNTPSVAVDTPVLTPKKVKLNVFGLPGITSLSGETDGSIKIKAKVSLPDFTVYLGDPPGSTVSNATGLNPFGLVEDEVENPDPYEETGYIGQEEDEGAKFDLITQTYTAETVEADKKAEKELQDKGGKVESSGEGNGPGCPALPGKLKGTVVSSKVVGNAYGGYAKGLDVFIAKLDIAFNDFTSKIGSIDIYNKKYSNVLVGDSWRSFTTQKKAYDDFVAGGKVGPNKASPCSGYHVAGQAVDLNQGGSYTTKEGKKVTFLKDITTHGILYKALYDAGLRRIGNEWWHWSLGEATHVINKAFAATKDKTGKVTSPADDPNFTKYT
jgi:hypothetical protein